MADGLCDWDEGTPHARNHILTTLSPPATVELCDEHYGPGLIPLLAAELGVDPGPFYTNVERYLARESKKAGKAVADAQAAEADQADGPPVGDSATPSDDDLPEPNFYAADGPAYAPTGDEAA